MKEKEEKTMSNKGQLQVSMDKKTLDDWRKAIEETSKEGCISKNFKALLDDWQRELEAKGEAYWKESNEEIFLQASPNVYAKLNMSPLAMSLAR